MTIRRLLFATLLVGSGFAVGSLAGGVEAQEMPDTTGWELHHSADANGGWYAIRFNPRSGEAWVLDRSAKSTKEWTLLPDADKRK